MVCTASSAVPLLVASAVLGAELSLAAINEQLASQRAVHGPGLVALPRHAMYHDPLVTRVGVPDWLVPVGPCVPPLGVGTIDLPDFSDSDGEDSDADDEDAGGSVQHPSECGTFLRNASRRLPAVAAWHGAVPCAAVRAALEADAKLLVRAATASTFCTTRQDVRK